MHTSLISAIPPSRRTLLLGKAGLLAIALIFAPAFVSGHTPLGGQAYASNDLPGTDDPTDANDNNGVDQGDNDTIEDNGVDQGDHDANDDNGVDNPATHDAGDDSGNEAGGDGDSNSGHDGDGGDGGDGSSGGSGGDGGDGGSGGGD